MKRYQFIRYCTVGTLAAGNMGFIICCREYEMANLNIAYIDCVTSFICNFFLTSYFTFRSNPSLKRALIWRQPFGELSDTYGLFNLFL